MNKLARYERFIYRHRFRSQVLSKVARRFPPGSPEFGRLMGAIDDVTRTHACQRRRNGQLKQQHEFAVLCTALEYCPKESVEFFMACVKHDMVEDYEKIWSFDRILDEDGDEMVELVWPVTAPAKHLGESIEEYAVRKFLKVAVGGTRPKKIKIMDRLHNLHTLLRSGRLLKQAGYVAESVRYVLPWVEEMDFMKDEFRLALKKQASRIRNELRLLRKE